MVNRLSYWVQFLPLPPEDRRRLMSVLDLVAYRLICLGANRKKVHSEVDKNVGIRLCTFGIMSVNLCQERALFSTRMIKTIY